MNEQNYLVEALIRALQDRWGRNISVPSDCEMLAKDITKSWASCPMTNLIAYQRFMSLLNTLAMLHGMT